LELFHATARLSVDWMVYCLIEGAILSMLVWVVLRLLPRQNAGTRFVLWFSALMAMIVLPFLRGPWRTPIGSSSGRALLTMPDSVAFYTFCAWAGVAALALLRVVIGLWQVQRLRQDSQPIDRESLHPEVRQAVEEFSASVALRVSDRVRVPTAIGFFAPTVIVPNWFLEEMSAGELRHVLLHELAHLRRRDDWTNLLQKIIKALLFFHPSAWWIEQQLSLEREVACDDAVLAQSAHPQDYAKCLKHVAEKSFLRRKLALAQAIVTRMRQLSLRMARILDVDRPGTTRLWKPAVPIVVAVACICGFSAATAPELLSFTSGRPDASIAASSVSNSVQATGQAREVKADLRSTSPLPKLVLADSGLKKAPQAHRLPVNLASRRPAEHPAQAKASQRGDYFIQSEQLIVTMTSDRVNTAGQTVWQVHMWQVRVLVPANNRFDKNISRKNI
jgi:beta-lactamase regulating signal transducer with metallopeptidase domain